MSDLISRQDVFNEIRRVSGYLDNDMLIRLYIGLNMLPSAQPDKRTAERTETHACDCISREAAIDAIHEDADWLAAQGSDWQSERMERDKSILKSLPSSRPDIIACGDCIHWICHDRRCGYWNHGVKPLDWCCHAERRTDEYTD